MKTNAEQTIHCLILVNPIFVGILENVNAQEDTHESVCDLVRAQVDPKRISRLVRVSLCKV